MKQRSFLSFQFFIVLILALVIFNGRSKLHPHKGNLKASILPKYSVQLNDPPIERWKHIAKDYIQELLGIQALVSLIKIDESLLFAIDYWAHHEFKYQDYVQEMQGISEVTKLKFSYIFIANFAYELNTACTGILIRDENNTIMHGRNLDFNFQKWFSKLSAQVTFYRGDKAIAEFDQIIGYVFGLTGMRIGKYAIEVNTRSEFVDINEVIKNIIYNKAIPSTLLVRQTILNEEIDSFEEAVHILNTTNITSPVYYIISGTKGNEGAVIEREPYSVHGYYQLNDTTWFLVQTNYDRDVPDPENDYRRVPAENIIKNIGQHITYDQLYNDILMQYPSLNSETIYTVLYDNQKTYHKVLAWYGTILNDHKNKSQIKSRKID